MKRYSVGKRILAWMLSLALVLSAIPAFGLLSTASAAMPDNGILITEADGSTLDSWKDAFDPKNISTEHAGGVWTDKSVVLAQNVSNVFGNIPGLEAAENNFLVALSALAANSVVVGQGATPTDTVFVLDISGSMNATELGAMVSAANDAIHTLLTGNEKSRVGVVLYSDSASVLLPLDRYTPVVKGQNTQTTADDSVDYIELTNSNIRAARTGWGNNTTYLKNGVNQNVTTSISLGGGTYIQGGLWRAWQQFNTASVTDQRTPVMVLMSDGAPTFTTNDYNNVPNSYETGTGNDSNDGDAFVTQLTAAYVKEKMADKYSTAGHPATAYFYTLGLGVSSSNNSVTVAEAVLDTSKERTGIEEYWDDFLALANAQTKTMTVPVSDNAWFGYSNVMVTYDATVTEDSREFVNKAFSASNASELSAAFQGIVNEISLQAGYYVTRLDGTGTNNGGYVTFVDELGTGMEFKELEGILIGNTLYTGELLAEAMEDGAFGSVDNPTALGDNLVWAVKERLRIRDNGSLTATEIARDLLSKAYAAGQIGYDSATGEFSNYIAWFGNANGEYIGFWDDTDPDATIPEGAVYANICYGMLGATTDSQTAHASDLLYVSIQVAKKITEVSGKRTIEANTPQTVTFRIPAGLLPTVTYQISVEADTGDEITAATPAKIVYNAAQPIRLVYEVGVHSQLTPENIEEFIRPGYQAKDDQGNYYLYTNAWNWEGADLQDWKDESTHPKMGDAVLQDTSKNAITYAYFEPGEDNEHYYFPEDALIYTKTGNSYTPYTGSGRPDGTYYYKHLVYTATADPGEEVTAVIEERYVELSEKALELAQPTNGANTWYVPEGTMHRNMHDHNRDKSEMGGNITGSFFAIRHQLVDIAVNGDGSHHYELVYMGNNGRVTYSPAQGFSLTKDMVQGETAEGQTFSFTAAITGDSDNLAIVTQNGVITEKALNSGVLELTLKAGETVTVTGLSVGATYTIEENVPEGYRLSNIAAVTGATVSGKQVSNTVEENAVQAYTYYNAIQYYGSLLITKTVTYEKNSKPAEANTKRFPVKLTLTGMGGQKVYIDGEAQTLDANGSYTFSIRDGQAINVTGIPEGTEYTVEELVDAGRIPLGFGANSGYVAADGQYTFTGTIVRNDIRPAAIQNTYTPADVVLKDEEPKIDINVNKNLKGTYPNWSFDFVLKKYDGNGWVEVKVDGNTVGTTATEAAPNPTIDLKGVTLDTVGVHYFRVEEVIPEEQTLGMIYDRTFHDFKITVVDDLTGQLKIQSIEPVQHAEVTAPTDPNGDGKAELWNVTAKFNNEFIADSTKLTIQANKELYNITTGNEVKMDLEDGQFSFTLYDADHNFENLAERETSRNGIAGQIIFKSIPYEYTDNGPEKTYYYVIKENPYGVNGYEIDDSEYRIKVTVKQVGNGSGGSMLSITEVKVWEKGEAEPTQGITLTAGNILNGDTIQFKNTYEAAKATATIRGTKYVRNETPGVSSTDMAAEDGLFRFTLAAKDNAPMPNGSATVTNTGSTFSFPEITYDKVGTYSYTVTEEAVAAPGYRKDATVHNVTVRVTDNGQGELSATVLYDGQASQNGAVFTNTYKAETVTDVVIRGDKTLLVDAQKFTRTLKAGEFTFVLTKPDRTTERVTNDVNGDFSFAALRFDTLGTYDYTVTEVGAGTVKDGVTYDTASYEVTVTVTDTDLDGKLEANVAYQKVTPQGTENATTAAFVNSYAATKVPVRLTAHKYLNGIRDLEANEFRFTMSKPGDATFIPQQKWNEEDGTVTFDLMEFDAAGTYVYTIVEDMVDKNGQPIASQNGEYFHNGVHYSQITYTVTVEVVDNGFGALVAHVTSEDNHGNELPVQFFNRYETESVKVNLTGENGKLGGKTLEDKTGNKDLSDFDFRFVLTDAAGNEIETVSDNDVNGFKFTEIEFTEPGDYVYYIHESNTQVEGVIYDTAVFEVTVKVTDDGVGHLHAVWSYIKHTTAPDGTPNSETVNEIAFANTYEADPAAISIVGNKTLTNKTPGMNDAAMATPAGKFFFKLTALNGAPLAQGNTTGYEIVSNAPDGSFTFTNIPFTKEGVFEYTITEEAPQMAGVTKDGTTHKIQVTVTDNGGQLVVAIIYDDQPVTGNAVQTEFHNEYLAKPVTNIVLSGSKELEGGITLNPGDFSFKLTKSGEYSETVANDGFGKFTFSALSFDKPGTYTYQINEVGGGTVKDGIAYDGKTITVDIVVEDNGEGQLIAKVGGTQITTYDVGSFKNVYSAQPVTVNLTGENDKDGVKTLKDKTSLVDKTLNDFTFKFVLTDEEGKVLETVSDNGSGFNFADITYDKPTEAVYYILEQNENVPGVTYDTAKYKVTVKVTDNKLGRLEAELIYEKLGQDNHYEKVDEISFANTYEAKKTSVTFAGNKSFLGGRDLKTGEFSFVLKDAQGVPLETVKNDANGKFTFTAIEYTQEGTYVYGLTEVAGTDSMVTYDDTEYVLTVTVKDVAGELVATTEITADGEPAQSYGFTNIFTPASVGTSITVKKILQNNTDKVMGLDGFAFNLYCVEANKTVSVVSGTDGLAKFDLQFTSADAGKTYTYRLYERKGSVAGMLYSNVVHEIKVVVGQNGETGELVLTVTKDGKAIAEQLTFTNVLNEVSDSGDVPPKTGDDTVIGGWLMAMCISAVAILAVLVIDRKRSIQR